MGNKKTIAGQKLVAVVLAAVLLFSSLPVVAFPRETQPLDNAGIPSGVFVGNFTAGGEQVRASTVVFKKGVSENIVSKAYGEVLKMYTFERTLSVANGKQVKVREVKVSRLVMDKQGRYMFRVAEKPEVVKQVLRAYGDYVEAVVAKPVPRTFERLPEIDNLPKLPSPAPTNVIIGQLIGAAQVRSVYGVNGSGVNIAIVDTGVDFGHPDLTSALAYWSGTYKGEWVVEPLVFDADESQVLLFQDVQLVNSTHVYVGGKSYTTLIPWPVDIYPPYDYYRIPLSVYNMVSQPGGGLRFGVTYLWRYDGIRIVGVLLVKPYTFGYYAYALIDVNNNGRFDDEVAPPIDPYGRGSVLRYSANRVIAPDYDRNGFPDDSFGVAGGFFYDWWWYFNYPAEISLAGIDRAVGLAFSTTFTVMVLRAHRQRRDVAS